MLAIFVAILMIAIVYVLAPVMISTHGQFVDPLQVICPRDTQPAVVTVNARQAALTSALGMKSLRITGCSLWPGQAGCDRSCIRQLAH